MKEQLRNLLENMSYDELIAMWNQYQRNTSGDDYIYNMDDFDEIMSCKSPWEIARTCYYSGNFCPANDYFWFNAYGNAESSDCPTGEIYINDLIDYIIDNNDSLYNDKIEDILNNQEEIEQ